MKREDVAQAIYLQNQRTYTNAELAEIFKVPQVELMQAIEEYKTGKFEEPKEEPKPKARGKKKT